ncbi:hypothetical protein [Legionella fairfieldensis]|nr:hypothetical protein [Legionella fairfieldensis]
MKEILLVMTIIPSQKKLIICKTKQIIKTSSYLSDFSIPKNAGKIELIN